MSRFFGLNIFSLSKSEVAHFLENALQSKMSYQVVTANPEMFLTARRDQELKSVIQSSSLVLPDGVGLVLMSFFFDQPLVERITGNDIVEMLLEQANRLGKKVYFLGGAGGQAQKAATVAKTRYPNLLTAFDSAGRVEKINGQWQMAPAILEKIEREAPEILLVAFGHGKQEKWISDHLSRLSSVRVAVGVGGALAFLSGEVRRAPKWLQSVGLEWLYRLILEPKRLWRIVNAVLVFPITVLFDRIRMHKV